jgi:hypothetical protein
VRGFVDFLGSRLDGRRVIVIGHGATRLALDHLLTGKSLKDAASDPFKWESVPPSFQYQLHVAPST